MATAVWPATLPQRPLSRDIKWTPQNNKVSFKPDVGPSIERRRGTAVAYDYTATFPPIDATQVATFETFFHTKLAPFKLVLLLLFRSKTFYFFCIRDECFCRFRVSIEEHIFNFYQKLLWNIFI